MPLQATSGTASYDAFGGGAAVEPVYIEQIFQTYLYTGNGSTQTITNGIDESGKGAMTWIKCRSTAYAHRVNDTVRGASKFLATNSTAAEDTNASVLTAFTSSGFSVGASTAVNENAATYASWTFRKQPKFFDVVTYTGDGTAGRQIAHSLNSSIGAIIVKNTNVARDWAVWHRSLADGTYLKLNTTDAAITNTSFQVFGDASGQTSTYFTVGKTGSGVNGLTNANASGETYVAYVFAHNAGGFGLTGTDNVISCGSFTTDGSGNATVNLGYEPQWLLIKSPSNADNWKIGDNMRGWTTSEFRTLLPNLTNAEGSSSNPLITSTGFQMVGDNASRTFIYIAIRRGPMKVPTSGTSVFYPQTISQADTIDSTGVPFPPDLVNTFSRNGTGRSSTELFQFVDRLRGLGTPNNTFTASAPRLVSSDTAAENTGSSYVQLKADSQNITRGSGWNSASYGNWIDYFWRRAPSTFDEVCFTPTGVAQTITHNLGVAPELIIGKTRDAAFNWYVYAAPLGNTQALYLNTTDTPVSGQYLWNNTSPTASVFSVGTGGINTSAATKSVAYLWATNAGVTKVGSYTGNGSSQTINCGFTSGSRMVLIIRTDASGDRYIWDSARGIVSGNDPHLSLNSTAAEVTTDDTIDTDSTGFIVNQVSATNCNVNGASYIVLAVA